MLLPKLVYSFTVHFSTVCWMSVHEINKIQINVQKSKKSYHPSRLHMDNVLLQEYVPRGVDIPFTNYRQRLDLNFKAAIQTVNAHLNQNHTFPEFSFPVFSCLISSCLAFSLPVFSCLIFSQLAFLMVPKFHFSHFQSPRIIILTFASVCKI